MEGAREMPKLMLRVPVEVKARLQECAKLSMRSMNSEIVGRLVRTLEEDDAKRDAKQK